MAEGSPVTSPRHGVTVTGEFLSVGPGRTWVGSDGKERKPSVVTLLVRDRTVRLEYASDAQAAFWVGSAVRGDVLTLPVFVRSPKNSTTVFFSGLRGGFGDE